MPAAQGSTEGAGAAWETGKHLAGAQDGGEHTCSMAVPWGAGRCVGAGTQRPVQARGRRTRPRPSPSSVGRSREGPRKRGTIAPSPGRNPSRSTKARVSVSCPEWGPSWPQAGPDRPGFRVVQALSGDGRLPTGAEGTWVPFLFLSHLWKSTREEQGKMNTPQNTGRRPIIPDSVPGPQSPCS